LSHERDMMVNFRCAVEKHTKGKLVHGYTNLPVRLVA
jgi:hypothetical protein